MAPNKFLPFVLLFLFQMALSQDLATLSLLENTVEESSGLIYLDGRIITHNDSGGSSSLFEIEESTGNVIRQVTIANATNRDWEDIEYDATHIYIGDFGNNNGTRQDLKVYKVTIADYLNGDDQATAEIIEFSYEDQSDFTSSPMNTNFDAEGLIAYEDHLFIFTKNWVDNRTHIYRLSKTPGTQTALRVDEFDSEGLVTGATYNAISDRVILVGYRGLSPFLTQLSGFSGGKFSNGTILRSDLKVQAGNSVQIEAIGFENATRHLLTSESNALGDAALMDITLATLSTENTEELETLIYPNPAGEKLWVHTSSSLNRVEIYDYSGKLVLEKRIDSDTISLDELPIGNYLIRLYSDKGTMVKRLIRE